MDYNDFNDYQPEAKLILPFDPRLLYQPHLFQFSALELDHRLHHRQKHWGLHEEPFQCQSEPKYQSHYLFIIFLYFAIYSASLLSSIICNRRNIIMHYIQKYTGLQYSKSMNTTNAYQ